MVPIFPPWETSTLSTLLAGRAPAPRREARVAAVCGFLPRQRVCVRRNGKSQRCANVRKKHKIAIQQRDCDFERRRSGMDETCRLRRGEGYVACIDEKQDKRMASEPTLFLVTTARSADCIRRLRRRCDWRLFGEK